MAERIIADYSMDIDGPLVIAIGAVHGNEPAGVLAIERVQEMLEKEIEVKPDFIFKGRFLGLIGNLEAYKLKKRFIVRDLNRVWGSDNDLCRGKMGAGKFAEAEQGEKIAECIELDELKEIIQGAIDSHKHQDIVLLDLHTTSAQGGIFSISLEGHKEIEIAKALHAPVVRGLLKGLSGTLLHYYKDMTRDGVVITPFAFEAGSHQDPHSIDRSVAAIICSMKAVGCVDEKDVNSAHEQILKDYAANLPEVVELDYVYKIAQDEGFEMNKGYINFQPVHKGEHLATNHAGPIICKSDGLILMPLYQPQGTDGFFIVKEVVGAKLPE